MVYWYLSGGTAENHTKIQHAWFSEPIYFLKNVTASKELRLSLCINATAASLNTMTIPQQFILTILLCNKIRNNFSFARGQGRHNSSDSTKTLTLQNKIQILYKHLEIYTFHMISYFH
jgi:hypothetical protein